MGYVPSPRLLTEEELISNNFRDIEFEKWIRYCNNPLGLIPWIYDFFHGGYK